MTETNLPDAASVRTALAGTRWRRIEVVSETGSTNADLVARAGAGEDLDGTGRIAGRQTAGRGRHARVWQTPDGQLAVSAAVAVRAEDAPSLGWLSLLTGLAVREAVAGVAGAAVELKWPNDILVADGPDAGKKLSGILSEFRPTGPGGIAVIGTGLNLDLTAAEPAIPTAACLRSVAGTPVDATAVVVAYLSALSRLLDRWQDDLPGLADDYRSASATLGRPVRLILPGDVEVIGTASAVDEQGRIVVDGPDGPVTAAAGDVTHLRPA
ncbi:MAG: biotin--[acetyl-CoA-carboxylase] ligase [Gordonia sp. (in: high G+C Gram-positive bacteria)]|uniref:biotin--[acetyl-CoA-carboxylase] ligase n=1 Tax=Gordonia sp. (in: high G+C Gram-positive bacteria) TaxID=84139 RepID=UPI0039E30E53